MGYGNMGPETFPSTPRGAVHRPAASASAWHSLPELINALWGAMEGEPESAWQRLRRDPSGHTGSWALGQPAHSLCSSDPGREAPEVGTMLQEEERCCKEGA